MFLCDIGFWCEFSSIIFMNGMDGLDGLDKTGESKASRDPVCR